MRPKRLFELTKEDLTRLFDPHTRPSSENCCIPFSVLTEIVKHPEQDYGDYMSDGGNIIVWKHEVFNDQYGHHEIVYFYINPE